MIEMRLLRGGLNVEVKFARYFKPLVDRIKHVDGAEYDQENKRWFIPLNRFLGFYQNVCEEFLVELSPGLKKIRDRKIQPVEHVFSLPLVETDGLLLDGFEFKPHQHEALSHAIHFYEEKEAGAIIAIPVGGGKTLVGIGFHRYTGMPALLICPASIKVQWAREILLFTGGTSLVIQGNKKKREKLWAEARENGDKYDFIICNYEQVVSDYEQMPARELMIIDEAHRLKNPSSKRSKQIFHYKRFKSRVCLPLTGTFLINAKHDAWNLMRLAGHPFGKNFYEFQKAYCWMDDYGNVCGVKYPHIRPYVSLLEKITYVRTKAELMKHLPPRNPIKHYVELESAQRKFYDTLLDGELTLLGEDGWDPTDIQGVWARLRQAAAIPSTVKVYEKVPVTDKDGKPVLDSQGRPKMKNGDEIPVKAPDESAKLDWLGDFLEDFDEPYFILYSPFTTALDEIQKRFPKEPWVRIDGSVDPGKRQAIIDKARASGKAYFLITDALKEGANLQFCSDLIFFSLPLTDADREQIEGRIWREGQQKISNIHYLLALDTIDISIYQMLMSKRELMATFKKGSMRAMLRGAA